MTTVSKHELRPDRDAVDLMKALGRVRPHEKQALQESVAELCRHPDPDVQSEAIRLLTVRWKSVEFRPMLVEMCRSTAAAPEVRQEAFYGLAATSSDTTRDDDSRICLGVISEDDEDLSVRGAAYDALLIIHRNPSFPTKRRLFDPASDIDSAWLEQLKKTLR